MPEDDLVLDAELVKVLASDTRLDLLALLARRRMTLSEMARAVKLSKATVLEHLDKLLATGLVRRRDDHRMWVYYDLTRKGQRLLLADTPVRLRLARDVPAPPPRIGLALAVVASAGIVALALVAWQPLMQPALGPQEPSGDGLLGGPRFDRAEPAFVLTAMTGDFAPMPPPARAAVSPSPGNATSAPAGGSGGTASGGSTSGNTSAGSPTAPAASPPPSPAPSEEPETTTDDAPGGAPLPGEPRGTLRVSFVLGPALPVAGQPAVFDILVLNPGNATAAGPVAVLVDGHTVAQAWFEVNASGVARFRVEGVFSAGEHVVRVGDLERFVAVARPDA